MRLTFFGRVFWQVIFNGEGYILHHRVPSSKAILTTIQHNSQSAISGETCVYVDMTFYIAEAIVVVWVNITFFYSETARAATTKLHNNWYNVACKCIISSLVFLIANFMIFNIIILRKYKIYEDNLFITCQFLQSINF